jgi:hypothetical protein
MKTSKKPAKLPQVFPLLRQSLTLYRAHWDIYLGYAGWLFLPVILSLSAFLLFPAETSELIHAGVSQLVFLLLVSWVHIVIILITPLLLANKPIPFHRLGKNALLLLLPYLITLLAVQLLGMLGLLLLLLPGLFLLTRYQFAPLITVLQGASLREAFRASARLSQGRLLPVFSRLFGGTLVLALAMLLCVLGIEIARALLSQGDLQTLFLSPPNLLTEIIYQAVFIFFIPALLIYQILLYLALEKTAKDS